MDADEMLRVENAVLILEGSSQVSRVILLLLLLLFRVELEPKWASSHVPVEACTKHGKSGVWSWARLCGVGRKEKLKYLSSGIDNLGGIILVLVLDHFAKSVLNGWIVAVDKVAVDELHRHTRLACAKQRGSVMLRCLLWTCM